MKRIDLLHLLIGQAHTHGFVFRRWFVQNVDEPWTSYNDALRWIAAGRRAHMLLFSHAFAERFFRSGERITYLVEPQTFERVTPQGDSRTVNRKAHLRRSSREDVWRFHLREMATAAEPLRYIRRFLITDETLSSLSAGEKPAQTAAEWSYDDENLVRDAG